MPKGQKLISWNDKAITDLFVAFLATHDVKPDYHAVGQVMEPNLPSSCIAQQFQKLRKSAFAKRVGPTLASRPLCMTRINRTPAMKTTSAPLPRTPVTGQAQASKKRKRNLLSDDENDADNDLGSVTSNSDNDQLLTPSSPSADRPKRTSARSLTKNKKDYKFLEDPYATIKIDGISDEEEEGKDGVESESGSEFGVDRHDISVKEDGGHVDEVAGDADINGAIERGIIFEV